MNYNFDEIINRRGTYSLKWDGEELIKQFGLTERYDEDTIPLFTADMDLPVPQPLVDALHKTVDHRIYGYSVFPDEYFDAIQAWMQKRHDWTIEKEHIVYSPGTVHALSIAVKAFTNAEDGIMIQRPVYPPFTSVIEGNNRNVVNNALKKDDDGYYSIDFEDFEAKAQDDNTKMFILCNPHNPTGRNFNEDELKKMATICHKHNVLIVADEIHGDLLRRGEKFVPMAKVAEHKDHIITCTAINKTFNVAGLHCTNVIISDEELRTKFSTEMGMQLASPFAIAALIAVYNEGEDWLEQLKDYVDGTMTYIKEFLADNMPEVNVAIPEGTYIMWLDFSGYGISAKEIHDRIYNKANVLLEDGSMFGEEGEFFQRICTPSPRPLIQEALERIAKEFEDISKK
ncbi:MAG: pyridoxal phosphate-dependent aminotransferase [Planococcus sp. (in: firmicutes)]|uniref:MalY/PatB family protein n=1 Tax=Planococcus halocryophilus TaxID=1215089 RepID=UPI001F100951|nr:MalY/PatB family protein [Planococcus halocryophilus]MCH4825981.1 pyridoxal phosphate-dependent aminotransferase [Planococcus halocryophilus]